MKRVALILTVLVLAGAPCVAKAGLIKGGGLKLGATVGKQEWDYTLFDLDAPYKARWGWDAGAYLELLTTPPFSILAEAHYIQKGFRYEIRYTTPENPLVWKSEDVGPRVDYLSIPVLAKIRFGQQKVAPYLLAGPRCDFLIHRESKGYHEVIDAFEDVDFGASFGAGVEAALPPIPGILAEVRWSPSFTHAYDTSLLTVTNRSVEFLVGVRL